MSRILEPVTVEIDIPVTRRTKIHAVCDGDGEQIFHSRKISQVFNYLVDHGVEVFELLDEDDSFMIKLSRPLPPAPLTKGSSHG